MAIERPIIERIVKYAYHVEPEGSDSPYAVITLGKGRYSDQVNVLTGEPTWIPEAGSDGRWDEKEVTISWGLRDMLVRAAEADLARADEAEAELSTLPEAHENYAHYLEWLAGRPDALTFKEAADAADDPMKRHLYLMLGQLRESGALP